MSNSILFLFSIIILIILIHYFVESVLFLICPECKIRKRQKSVFNIHQFITLMLRQDGDCASFIYLRELRQYLLVHHFRWRGTWPPSDGHSYFNNINVTPIHSILYLPRIKNMEYNFIYLPYSRFLIRSNRFYSLFAQNKE